MEVSSITEQLLFTTLRIYAKGSGVDSVGTGFILEHKFEDKAYLFLVTNKHVIKGATEGLLTFIKSDGQKPLLGQGYPLRITGFENIWFGHEDSSVDVAIAPLVPVLNEVYKGGARVFFRSVPNELMLNEETLKGLDAVEEVLFVGYPAGIWDETNLTPVVRRGITATSVHIDFNGRKQFLIDASVFPGSSGSPVFVYNAGMYWDKKSGGTVVGNRLVFLGILSEVFQMEDSGELVVSKAYEPKVKIRQLADLGIVFKSQTIVETIDSFLKSHATNA